MEFPFQKKRRWPWVLLAFTLFFAAAAGFGWWRLRGLVNPFKELTLNGLSSPTSTAAVPDMMDIMKDALGFKSTRTYLVLFLNNTELRPGGGFIGSYAVARVRNGSPIEIKVEGTEILDRGTPPEWNPEPPKPIKKYLGVDKWYFRDSNWSPDFQEDVQRAISFYKAERGYLANEIDTVVAVTPTVLEEVLRIIGPIRVEGINFTADNVTEKLERQVEYDYKDSGIDIDDRKDIINEFIHALIAKVQRDAIFNSDAYVRALTVLGQEKHVLVASENKVIQGFADAAGWSGRVIDAPADYLLWVDANLGALKTDHAMKRDLLYSVKKKGNAHVATAEMEYKHTGSRDWRTTRYRTYARVFVPLGSELIGGAIIGRKTQAIHPQNIDSGVELGKQWFGAFVSVETGETAYVQFTYKLPKYVSDSIDRGQYNLLAQKQLGTIAHGLTIRLDFDKTISSASPGEAKEKWGDKKYELETDLRVDREFIVSLKQ